MSEELTGGWGLSWRGWGKGIPSRLSARAPALEEIMAACLGKRSRTVGSKEEWAQMGLRDDEGSDHEDPTS